MRKTITAILLCLIISTSLTSCSSSSDMGGRGSDAPGMLMLAVLVGAGAAIAVH